MEGQPINNISNNLNNRQQLQQQNPFVNQNNNNNNINNIKNNIQTNNNVVNNFHTNARDSRYSKISQQEFNNYYSNLSNQYNDWSNTFANTDIYSNQLTYTIAKCLDRYYKRYKNDFIDQVSNNIRQSALIHSFCSSFLDTLDWCSKNNNYNTTHILQNYFFFDINDRDLFDNKNAFDGFNKLVQN